MTERTLYLSCTPDDVAPLVLLSGDPARVTRGMELLDGARLVSQNREYAVATGMHQGTPVTLASGGIGSSSTAIAVHELHLCGARAIVRVGTIMGVFAPMGSVVLSTGAVRGEATALHYLPVEYPAVPDFYLTEALAHAGRVAGLDVRLGITATENAFYLRMAPGLIGAEPPDLTLHRRAGVLGMEMETALLFVLCRVLGIPAAAMCLTTVQAEPFAQLDVEIRAAMDERLVCAALDGIVVFGAHPPKGSSDEEGTDHPNTEGALPGLSRV